MINFRHLRGLNGGASCNLSKGGHETVKVVCQSFCLGINTIELMGIKEPEVYPQTKIDHAHCLPLT